MGDHERRTGENAAGTQNTDRPGKTHGPQAHAGPAAAPAAPETVPQPPEDAAPVAFSEPPAGPGAAPYLPDRTGTLAPEEPGGTEPGPTAEELHTPAPGGLEERIVAVRPVPGTPWKRALFRATRGRVNLETS